MDDILLYNLTAMRILNKSRKDLNYNIKSGLVRLKKTVSAAKLLLSYVYKKSPIYLIGYLISIIFDALIPFLSLWIVSKLIDELINNFVQSRLDPTSPVFYLIIAVVVIAFLKKLNDTASNYFEVNLWFDVARELDKDVTKKFAYLDTEYYENPEMRDLLNKVSDNYDQRPQQFFNYLMWLLHPAIELIASLSILILFNPLIILLVFLSAIPELYVQIAYGERSYGIWDAKASVKRDYYLSKGFVINENSLMELRVFGVRNYLLDRIYKLFTDFQNQQKKAENKRSLLISFLSIFQTGVYGVIIFLIISAVLLKKITVGLFNFYLSTSERLYDSLSVIVERTSKVYENGLFVYDIFKFLDLKEKIVSGNLLLKNENAFPQIRFENVFFKYPGRETPVLEDFSLVIEPGEHMAVVGENGAGKTTLIKLLMRFYDVDSGKILIDGIYLKKLNLENWYSKVAVLFQEFNFYHYDARTNIGMGESDKLWDFNKIVEAAKKSGAHKFIENYKYKYKQILNTSFRGGITPSTGQKQKIALARAFFKDAPMLILDEPTSAIDPKSENEIFEKLFEFAKGKTVLIISHRFSTVRNASRIIVLDKGKIVEEGSHEKLMGIEHGKYKQVFEIQKKGYE